MFPQAVSLTDSFQLAFSSFVVTSKTEQLRLATGSVRNSLVRKSTISRSLSVVPLAPSRPNFHRYKHLSTNCRSLEALCMPTTSTDTPNNRARHSITELAATAADALNTSIPNTTNYNATPYAHDNTISTLSTLTLDTSLATPSPPDRRPTDFPMVIANSGANRSMVNELAFFQSDISPPPPSAVVLLADNSSIPVLGIGTASCTDGTNSFTLPNVLYVPQLTDSLYSLQEHWRTPGHDVRKTSEDNLELVFPTFTTPLTLNTTYPHHGPIRTDLPRYTT